jgi:acyl phosphate:glycerol-3-phosphate acyltransferase
VITLQWASITGGAYLIGSIPFGIIFTRWINGIDPREHGSKNIGFSNVLRIAGWLPGLLTLVGDIGKGFLAVVIARTFVAEDELLMLFSGVAVVLGHNHPVFLQFRGGKGVATGFGVLLGINLLMGISLLLLWIIIVGLLRISALGAIACFSLLPAFAWWFEGTISYLVFSFIISFMILTRHRENIARLWKGVEPKLGKP